MTGPEGNSEFCFLRISMFPRISMLYSKTKQKQNLKTALRYQPSRATTVNISRVTVNYFLFDVIVFARSWHLAGNSVIVRCHVTMN